MNWDVILQGFLVTLVLALIYSTLKKGKTRKVVFMVGIYAFMFLFLYASFSKLFMYRIYIEDLHRSPLLGPYASVIGVLVPAVEIIIASLLFFERTRMIGLKAFAGLMVLFTGYVALVVFVLKDTPCTCGGLIRELTWVQHLMFNIFFTLWSFIEIKFWRTENQNHDADHSNFSLG